MKDIGKLTGVYFSGLTALSILSIPAAYFYQNRWVFELTWIVLLPVGILLWKHNNPARLLVIGWNILVFMITAGLFLFSLFNSALREALLTPQELTLFAIKIPSPSLTLLATVMTLILGASVILIAVLFSQKAKEEF